eukprot:TRINITY_DN7985_c0_g1_i1.p1 TRINITY_DN7985_c0_g1~~TRINITY_DN7985_c0_g1_i1.p1  ORF type:complete len:181 (+),score=40.87 TRINITY_DN7985_c0_g1_i1:7-549(+)
MSRRAFTHGCLIHNWVEEQGEGGADTPKLKMEYETTSGTSFVEHALPTRNLPPAIERQALEACAQSKHAAAPTAMASIAELTYGAKLKPQAVVEGDLPADVLELTGTRRYVKHASDTSGDPSPYLSTYKTSMHAPADTTHDVPPAGKASPAAKDTKSKAHRGRNVTNQLDDPMYHMGLRT